MGMISVRLNEEDEHDLKLYSEAISVHQKHSEAISFDTMVKDLNK